MMQEWQKEALRYDLPSLILLQAKRKNNVIIFECCIKKERETIIFEKTVQANLEERLQLHKSRVILLNDSDLKLIIKDLPTLADIIVKCDENIKNMQNAIIDEQEQMDREGQMIVFLEKRRAGKK